MTHTKGNLERSSFEIGLPGEAAFGSCGRGGVGNFDNMLVRTEPSSVGFAAGDEFRTMRHTLEQAPRTRRGLIERPCSIHDNARACGH